MKIRKTVGIDLGTTNSVIAVLDATDSTLLTGHDDQGRMTFPSIVGYHPDQRRLVAGRAARALRASDGSPGPNALPLASVKRHMGLDRRFPVGPENLTPQEASAQVLRLLRDMLGRTLNDAHFLLDSAVITMPAYFNHEQIEATRQAGELAGYDVVELLHEPTAAAIYYSWIENHGDATYLVYDLGGGTFDVSVIRRRLGDYEVLSVSGDPFLGGDDFDRSLASYLLENGTWRLGPLPFGPEDQPDVAGSEPTSMPAATLAALFNPTSKEGARRFARLVQVAENIKAALTDTEPVERFVPDLAHDDQGRPLSLEANVNRATLERLIKDKVERTIDCCREALALARAKAGLQLPQIDHVLLVGGSSRLPLVRATVREAFCNPDLPERVRCAEPLLHEPDLCVALGAALRAATHGTRYLFAGAAPAGAARVDLELHLTSPVSVRSTNYQVTGVVRTVDLAAGPRPVVGTDPVLDGASVRVRPLATGLLEEPFLDPRGTFAQEVELQPDTDNALELTVCDGHGQERARVVAAIRHQSAARSLGQAVLPTQIITKPLQLEVLDRARRRVKQVVVPVGASLPGTFRCTCRTQDQAGRVVVPIFEENRVVKQMVIEGLSVDLPVGSAVEVELAIDGKHHIEIRVRVQNGNGAYDRIETATVEPPPPARRPTRLEIDEVRGQIDELLSAFTGAFRSRMRARAARLHDDLLEALRFDDEPKAIQRMAELNELLQQLEAARGQQLDPPWPRFAQLVRHCLDLAAEVAESTGRNREELFEHVHAQERYAEQAYEEHNQALYRECRENLEKYAGYLDRLKRDALPRPMPTPTRPPEEEAKAELERFRAFLAAVWKQVRARQRADLEARLPDIARRAGGLGQRLKTEPVAVLREVRRLSAEVSRLEDLVTGNRRQATGEDAGLLEGSS
jgi:molecular chaperone DnaK